MAKPESQNGQQSDDSIGVSIPDEHVGAFVAEAFEDVERNTAWEEVVGALVAKEARDAWDELEPTEQVTEILSAADDYDKRAVEYFTEIPTDRGSPTAEIRQRFEEAMRCRRNADQFRDAVADAFAEDHVDDEELVSAIEAAEFDTAVIAEREDELERVANAYNFDFRPYGGTLMHDEGDENAMDDFEAW